MHLHFMKVVYVPSTKSQSNTRYKNLKTIFSKARIRERETEIFHLLFNSLVATTTAFGTVHCFSRPLPGSCFKIGEAGI